MKKVTFITTVMVLMLFKISYSQSMPDSIYYAIKKDDAVKLAKFVSKENINACYWKTYTALSQAVKDKAVRCVDLLLKKGANVNESCNYKPAIYMACKYGTLEILKKLAANGANLNPPKYENQTLLEYAEEYGNQPIIQYLKSLKK